MERALEQIGNRIYASGTLYRGHQGKRLGGGDVDNCLRAAGYHTGLYTKPHLIHLTEAHGSTAPKCQRRR